MKVLKSRNIVEEFFNNLAYKLITEAPDERSRDDLQKAIDFAFTRRLGNGHVVDGKQLKPKDLEEVLSDDSDRWIVGAVSEYQDTWLQTHDRLPCDLLKGEHAMKLLDLENAIKNTEQHNFNPSGEAKG